MGDFNARVRKYQNIEILKENTVDPPCLLRDSKDCIVMDYGRILIHMLDCTDMIVLNGINVFPLTKVITYLLDSDGRSVVYHVDILPQGLWKNSYVSMKACDLSMVNAFKVGDLV